MGELRTNKNNDDSNKRMDNYPTSQRRCVIEGQQFLIIRHFEGDKDLNATIMELAINRANREMGI